MLTDEILKKPYARLVVPDGATGYVAEIVEFPGCFATGESASEAIANLEGVATDWILSARAQGQTIPEPLESAGYSGKLVLRLPKSLHQRAVFFAEREDTSLNQFIVACVAERVGALSGTHARTLNVFVNAPPKMAAREPQGFLVVEQSDFVAHSAKSVGMLQFKPSTKELVYA
jgi:antitoxin HicB